MCSQFQRASHSDVKYAHRCVFISDLPRCIFSWPFFSGWYYCCCWCRTRLLQTSTQNEINLNGPISPWRKVGNIHREREKKNKQDECYTKPNDVPFCSVNFAFFARKKKTSRKAISGASAHIHTRANVWLPSFYWINFSRKRGTRGTSLCEFVWQPKRT